ncbi:MAG: glucoamylase family protein, partial [Bacilli bacterium]|nr:glucoamylase family protein [Bacilli bacterium]
GFYEAYDYEDKAVVKNYYAHHQGMILASLTNYLKDNIIREYFHTDKGIQSMEMLLKEKVQIKAYIDLKVAKYKRYQYKKETTENDVREFEELTNIPEVGLLSNGFYSTIINDRGIGFSKYKNLQINRYREIPDEDCGIFVYIRNLANNKVWSNTYAPIATKPNKYKVIMASDRIKYIREDEGIVTTTEIMVVKDHNAEVRKITFNNKTNKAVELEVTSYGEVIMARNEEDIAHRAFNSMTITSEVEEKTSSLIFSRNSRTKDYTTYFVATRMFLDGEDNYPFEFETSREHFISRNNNVSNPDVILNKKPLSNSFGATLDPIMSIRKTIKIQPKSTESVYLLVGFGKSKEQVMEIVANYNDELSVSRAFNVTTVFNNMRINYANLKASEMRLYSRMLKYISQRLPDTIERSLLLKDNKLTRESLWKFGVSGDWPIILVEIDKIEDLGFIKQILQAYEFYKSRAIYIDIVIINYEIPKKEKIVLDYVGREVYRINTLNYLENTPGNVYIISEEDMTNNEKSLLYLVSRLSFKASGSESLEEQLNRLEEATPVINELEEIKPINNLKIELPKEIDFYNGYGGFVNQGKEYLINNNDTPAPWINVLANPTFGSIISNNGSSFTFSNNSREYKLTTWSNDTIGDPSSEIIVINNQKFVPNLIKHGFGYSTLYSSTKDYDIFIKVYVSKENKEKFYKLNITNKKKTKLNLELDFIVKIVLGVSPELTNRYLVTTFNKKDNCLYVKNNYNNYFKDIKTFISSSEKIKEYSDKNHSTRSITVNVDIDANEVKTCSFVLGTLNDDERYKEPDNDLINDEYSKVTTYWKDKLSTITVETPDKAFNYMMNGWYLYQTYVSRLYARAAFYQVGGAYGFRDQLQDILALVYSSPDFARSQILKHASHQFKEGDVLHWWHEELMFGARTRFSDDYLWLPYITSEYIEKTGDYKILSELVPFVEGPLLSKTDREKGINYTYSEEKETLYNHLKLCLDKALREFGSHGLPLIGGGDWNDGMNKVGYKGQGESVFVGFFLYDILPKMVKIAKYQKDQESSKLWTARQKDLKVALDKNTWDGNWYLRAYFDNGVPLGSRNNKECQIDLLSQAWSIISGVASDDKKEAIYKSVEKLLIDNDNKIIKLLTPPFKDINPSPGYIKDYPAGIRENGAQYTHAALWYILALLKDNKGDKAYQYYQMINPINRSLNKKDVLKYKVEPYVIAADIYANPMHVGRGGWTWYTGSASWAYKIGLEEIIGFNKVGDTFTINPNINSEWNQYKITYKYKNTVYNIEVNNEKHLSSGKVKIVLDKVVLKENIIKLIDDNKVHEVIVTMEEEL